MTGPNRWRERALVAFATVCILSIFYSKLALFCAFLSFVAWLSIPSGLSDGLHNRLRIWVIISGAASLVGGLRFIALEAAPGIVEAGTRATARKAVSRLREILFVQDALRRHAYIDPDGDGIGSAALILELVGEAPLPSGNPIVPAPMSWIESRVVQTARGPALLQSGYLFLVCLQCNDGSWTARRTDCIDEERAERRFIAYAWPASDTQRLRDSFSIDEHENILVSTNERNGRAVRVGPLRPPDCAPETSSTAFATSSYEVWEGKSPRKVLPYDRPHRPSPP